MGVITGVRVDVTVAEAVPVIVRVGVKVRDAVEVTVALGVRVLVRVGVRDIIRAVSVRVAVLTMIWVKVRVGVSELNGVAETLAVADAVITGSVVAVRVGVAVAARVDVSAGSVGRGVVVGGVNVCVETGVWVSVRGNGGTGLRAGRRDVGVGVGVNKKTPVTTGSSSFPCPSSRRIISTTSGSMGATFS